MQEGKKTLFSYPTFLYLNFLLKPSIALHYLSNAAPSWLAFSSWKLRYVNEAD